MSTPEKPVRGSRVIVAVGPTASDPMALTAAARLARSAGAELAALFIEDINLLRLAELPFAFETGPASGQSRRISTSDVERAFKQQESELRRALAEGADALQIDWTFDIVRGQPLIAALEAAAGEDLVVLAGCAMHALSRSSPPRRMREALSHAATRPARARQRIAAVLQAPASAPRVLEAAQRLAASTGSDLLVLIEEQAQVDQPLGTLLGDWTGDPTVDMRIEPLPVLTPQNIATLISRNEAAAVFLPSSETPEMAADCASLLATITCPLIVVR